MKPQSISKLVVLALMVASVTPVAVKAQDIPFGDVGDDADEGAVPAAPGGKVATRHGPLISISPYIEAAQVVSAQLSPGHDVLTYSTLAAGVDASFNGRNNQGSVAVRYERRFGWGKRLADGDTLSGLARYATTLVPRAVKFEVGALATRSSVEKNGATFGGLDLGSSATRLYSFYAGPTVATRVGDVAVDGHYRFGYNRVEAPNILAVAPGQAAVDVFNDSTVHNALLHVGTRPGQPLPVGVGAGVGYNRENIANLDQQIEDFNTRIDVTVPLTEDFALVGGVGYEKVKVSSRDALRDPVTGFPVLDSRGRYVTQSIGPRQIAFETDGLIWDAGVLWRPSKRTALEAHFGRRYGSMTYFGSFAYAPSARTSVNISVYDRISTAGGLLNSALASLPARFEAIRNPLNGDLGGCVAAQGTLASGQSVCLGSALGSIRSSAFRSRGVMATLGISGKRLSYGVGAGYDRRSFLGAAGTVLAASSGTIDENIWLSAYFNGRIDQNSSLGATLWANWYQSGDTLAGDSNAVGATASYSRAITQRLNATAAIGLTGVNRAAFEDIWTAQALAGLRYSF